MMTPERVRLYSDVASVVLAVAVFTFWIISDLRRRNTTQPHVLLARAAGVAAVPQALVMIFGAFDPELICKVVGLRLAIVFGGLSLLYVSARSFTST